MVLHLKVKTHHFYPITKIIAYTREIIFFKPTRVVYAKHVTIFTFHLKVPNIHGAVVAFFVITATNKQFVIPKNAFLKRRQLQATRVHVHTRVCNESQIYVNTLAHTNGEQTPLCSTFF